MAWTNWGFDGTINEAQWAQMAGLLGNDYVAAGNGDCLVTAVPGARSVSVAAGTLYGDGVVSVNDGAETVAMTTPVNGQWYVIALRRTWATNTAALVAIAGATTSTTTPTAPPTSFPTLNTDKGVLTDQPIAWAWCNSANTTVVVYDIRMRAVKSLPPVVANGTERDAKFMTPTQGLQVWRNDLGAVETYYGLYNASTNPGGRDAAGWYVTGKQNGLVPIRPSSITVASGSATISAIAETRFNSVANVRLDNVFSSQYNNYRVVVSFNSASAPGQLVVRMSNGAVIESSTNYFYGGQRTNIGGFNVTNIYGNDLTSWIVGYISAHPDSTAVVMDFRNPFTATQTSLNWQATGFTNGIGLYNMDMGGMLLSNTSYNGFIFYTDNGLITGKITVYGYNA